MDDTATAAWNGSSGAGPTGKSAAIAAIDIKDQLQMNTAEQEAIERLEAAVTAWWAMEGKQIYLAGEDESGSRLTLVQRINRCAEEIEVAS